MFDDVIVVYKFLGDLMFFVTGSQDENELILCQVLQGFYEAISLLLRCIHRRMPYRMANSCSCESKGYRACNWQSTVCGLLCAGMLWRRRQCWRTWIWCFSPWTRLWMAGV